MNSLPPVRLKALPRNSDFAEQVSYTCLCADLSGLTIRKEVDMEDLLRRYDLEPLVKTETLDAGKRVLQKVLQQATFSCGHQSSVLRRRLLLAAP